MQMLRHYRWPGNVRELENVVEQAMVFADSDVLRAADLPSNLGGQTASGTGLTRTADGSLRVEVAGRTLPEVLDGMEKILLKQAYEKAGKVKTEAARQLGIKTSALYYKLDKYGIE